MPNPKYALRNRALYSNEIEKLVRKYQGTREFYEPDSQGESLADLFDDSVRVARDLAKAVQAGSHVFKAAKSYPAKVSDKVRTLYQLCWRDRIVHGVLASILTQALEPKLTRHLYSYRKGFGPPRALKELSAFSKTHRRKNPDKRDRGLFVLKMDVKEYGESISVSIDSPLWKDFQSELAELSEAEKLKGLLLKALSPLLREGHGGLPTGSPLVPPLDNLYLLELDRKLSQPQRQSHSWYGRYGDDILFMSQNPESVEAARKTIDAVLKSRGLEVSLEKVKLRFWNGAGRADSSGRIQGTQSIDYLGRSISFEGGAFPRAKRKRKLLKRLSLRIQDAVRVARSVQLNDEETLAFACQAINHALDPKHPFSLGESKHLFEARSDRKALGHFEKQIQLTLLRKVLGLPYSLKSFRTKTPADLETSGLKPLLRRELK